MNKYGPENAVALAEMFFKSAMETNDKDKYDWMFLCLGAFDEWIAIGYTKDKTKYEVEKKIYECMKRDRRIRRVEKVARTKSSEEFFIDNQKLIERIKQEPEI